MIGFIGGTGPEGRGLALRFARAGKRVLIGSRDDSRAGEAARSISMHAPAASISGAPNEEVARQADLVFITVPYSAHRQAIKGLKGYLDGKIVVDVVTPLSVRNGVATVVPVAEGSAALEAQAVLPGSTVVSAFQTISARDLLVPDMPVNSDVVVSADDTHAREVVMVLAEKINGARAVNGGGLENARYLENLAALLLNINRLYKARSAIKIVGI